MTSGFTSFVPPRGQKWREREREREREAAKHVGTIFIRIHFCPKNSSEIRRVFGSKRLGSKIRGRNKQIRTSVAGYLLFSTFTMNPPGVLLPVRAEAGAHHRRITRMWQICQTSSLRGVERIEIFYSSSFFAALAKIEPLFSVSDFFRSFFLSFFLSLNISVYSWKVVGCGQIFYNSSQFENLIFHFYIFWLILEFVINCIEWFFYSFYENLQTLVIGMEIDDGCYAFPVS